MARVPAVVSVKWLADALTSKTSNLRVLDASWHLPMSKRHASKEYHLQHIPGAVFFDIDECSDKTVDVPHNIPTSAQFENYVGGLGVGKESHVIIYDNSASFGLFSAQRVWWMFRVFGHNNVSVLDGGFPKWLNENYNWTDEKEAVRRVSFVAAFRPELVKNYNDIASNLVDKRFQLLDARSAGRFNGTAPEPRPDIKPGHIPGAINIPFPKIMDPESKTIKSPVELKKVFEEAGVDLHRPVVAMCGSGVTACLLVLAAHQFGLEDMPVYDGSWTEWYLRAKPEQKIAVK